MSCKDCYKVTPLVAPEKNILVPTGTTPVIRFTGFDAAGQPFDFTGKDFEFRLLRNEYATDHIFQYLTGQFVVEQDQLGADYGVNNVLRMPFDMADLEGLKRLIDYFYRVRYIDEEDGVNLVLMRGSFKLEYK